MLTSQKHKPKTALLSPHVSVSDLKEFLRLVAEGEQDQAETMLKSNPSLALVPGDVTDLSKRTFTNITAFQYAVWALDWHMWTMIRKYLPDAEAKQQAEGFETGAWTNAHGIHANLELLLDGYFGASWHYNGEEYEEGDKVWVEQIGRAQFLFPAHIINEYCHPTRPFDHPSPNFRDTTTLPRSRIMGKGEWFTTSHNGGKLGETFAYYRDSPTGWTSSAVLYRTSVSYYSSESKSMEALSSTRIAQREELIAELKPRSGQRNASDLKDLEGFLRLVAEGEQDQAEAMLKSNPNLALVPGDVTDLSKRTFKNITAFQYAVWALDWHMWKMIRKYLPGEAAKEQAKGFETGSWVKQYNVSAQPLLEKLINALQTAIDLYKAKKYTEGNTVWVQQVGGAQLLLPAHVINEYCHPTRPFCPLPNFNDELVLPRFRTTFDGDWFDASYAGGKLGKEFAFERGRAGTAGVYPNSGWATDDLACVRVLSSTCIAQRKELIAELRPKSVVNNPQTTFSATNPLLQSLQMQLMKGEGQSAASFSHKQTDTKISLETLAHDLQEIQREKQELAQTSQALKTQSKRLQETLQKEISTRESEYALLKQQQEAFQKQIEDLRTSLTQKSSMDQESIQSTLRILQEQLLAVQTKQEVLWNEHEAKTQKREALRRFQSHPNLLLFYRTVHIKLEEIFISFKTVAGGFVEPVEGNVAIAKSIFDALGDTVSIVPIVGAAVDKFLKWTVSKGLEKIDSARQKNTARNASELVTLSELKKYTESIARQLTERYADQLVERLATPEEEQAATHQLKQALDKTKAMVLKGSFASSAKQLAAFGVLWMIDQLYDAANIDVSKELDKVLLSVISQKKPPNKIKEFWQEITKNLDIGIRSKNGDLWHPEAVYTLPGLKVGDKYYSNGTLQPTIYGWRLGTLQEVQALGLRLAQVPATQVFTLETQKVIQSISAVNNTVKKVEQKTDEHSAMLDRMGKTIDIAGSAHFKALQADLAKEKKAKEELSERLARLEELHVRAASPVSKRRPSGIKNFTKKDEKENMLEALEELRMFFLGQRDTGEESANIETYKKYLKMANKDARLVYLQEERKHVLCIGPDILNRTAAAKAIWAMIQALESQTPQSTLPPARQPVRAVSPSPVNIPKAAPMTAPSASFEQKDGRRVLHQFQSLPRAPVPPLPTTPASQARRLNAARQMKKEETS